MLFKAIIAQYGNSVRSGHVNPEEDIIHAGLQRVTGRIDDMISFRERILDALSEAKPFFLDHRAADYVDHIASSMRQENGGKVSFMRDMIIPEDVVWIELDAHALVLDQKKRGTEFKISDEDIAALDLRGILFDNRDPDRLNAWVFRRPKGGALIDPITCEEFSKDAAGYPDLMTNHRTVTPHVLRYMNIAMRGGPNAPSEEELAQYDAVDFLEMYSISYALFAVMQSMKSDIEINEEPTFSPKEIKTARKFGKDHITSAPRSHTTIDLSDAGAQYMKEIREEFQDRSSKGNGTPKVRHTVKEHYRHYKSGKIVLVKAHERGVLRDTRPTRVTATMHEDDLPSP